MKQKTLALIHTGTFLVQVFAGLVKEELADVKVFNIVDESLLDNTIAAGHMTPLTARRLAGYIESAEEAGADVIMVTCSSVGPAVDAARPFAGVPLLRVDEAMADAAVREGRRIGVIATLPTTLQPTADLVRARAEAQGRDVKIVEKLCKGAFEAVSSGDGATHDRLVATGLRELMPQVDAIVLAQASMARVVDSLSPEEKTAPIFSSPRLGVEAAKKALQNLG
jgi:Asp/Glu/hydantoin racemase